MGSSQSPVRQERAEVPFVRRSIIVDEHDLSPQERSRQRMLSEMILLGQLREFRTSEFNGEGRILQPILTRCPAPLVTKAMVRRTLFHVRPKSVERCGATLKFALDSSSSCEMRMLSNVTWVDNEPKALKESTPRVYSPQMNRPIEITLPTSAKDVVIELSSLCGDKEWTCVDATGAERQVIRLHEEDLALLESKELFGSNEEQSLCGICMDRAPDTAVLPCRHLCLCSVCADMYCSRVQSQSYRCPMCRERTSSLLQMC